MEKLLYTIFRIGLTIIAFLPFWMLYFFSDILYFLAFHVIKYRRKVVRKNLSESFPEKTQSELDKIERQFYRNFTDYIVETIKLLHISDKEMKKRMEFVDVEIADRLLEQGKSIAAYFSHCFNWEWATSISLWSNLKCYLPSDEYTKGEAAFCQIYRPLKNKAFDRLMLKVRSRFHSISIPKTHTLRHLLTLRRDAIPSITGFMSDQKPSHGDPAYITTFMNHPTAIITGTETLARRLGMAAIYFDIEKIRRGHYQLTIRLISDDVSRSEPMSTTAEYTRMLQSTIERNPSIWLWSHKRWKIPVTIPDNRLDSSTSQTCHTT